MKIPVGKAGEAVGQNGNQTSIKPANNQQLNIWLMSEVMNSLTQRYNNNFSRHRCWGRIVFIEIRVTKINYA